MFKRTAGEIANACKGQLINIKSDENIGDFVIDSRKITKNSVFVAINGENVDGIDYAEAALKNGAKAIMSDRNVAGLPLIFCEDVLESLGKIAEYFRLKERKTVVGITGSVGKTTVKEILSEIILKEHKVCKTFGNYNNLIGVPLTLLKNDDAEIAVVEMGISEKGEMEKLSKIVKPDISVITKIGCNHSENLGSMEEIAKEKLKICLYSRNNSKLLLCDDENLIKLSKEFKNKYVISQHNPDFDYYISKNESIKDRTRISVMKYGNNLYENCEVNGSGEHIGYDGAVALTAADLLGMSEEETRFGLKSYAPCGERQKITIINKIMLISDCYNSSPLSMEAAIKVFLSECKRVQSKYGEKINRCMLLGGMEELGELTEREHFRIGKLIFENGIDKIITYGEKAKNFAKGAFSAGLEKNKVFMYAFEDENGVKNGLLNELNKNLPTVILVKGSRKYKMERFSEFILGKRDEFYD